MAVQIWKMTQGDEEPSIRVRVQDSDGLAIDLSDYASGALEYRTGGGPWAVLTAGASAEQGPADDTDATARAALDADDPRRDDTPERYWYLRYDWQVGDTDALAGQYEIRQEATRSGGNSFHVPSGAPWNLLTVST